ncbi:MAG: hypothetical protein NVS3B26_17090 [Mycobacteriales bacterium]
MARVPAKKTTARKAAPAKRAAGNAAPAKRGRPATRRTPSPSASSPSPTGAASAAATAPPAGSADLAGGLRALLSSVETEVRAVSTLSERIDELVRQLNDARHEQAQRLEVLDTLRGAVDDTNLGQFLDKAIRPRRSRVPEVVPTRLTQG